MHGFQTFQHAMAHHLRDPHHTPRPAGVPARRMAVYSELLFNNVCGFLDSCFPVCQQVLGPARWQRLCRTFYRDWPSHTPWFREIPLEFVRHLQTQAIAQPLPRWLAELAHYEWAELAVELMDVAPVAFDAQADLMARRVVLNPARIDIASPWPVHRIGPDWRPRQPAPTHLIVFRDAQQSVRFCETNALSARLLSLLAQGRSGQQALAQLARDTDHPQPQTLIGFGAELLNSLRTQGVILGGTP